MYGNMMRGLFSIYQPSWGPGNNEGTLFADTPYK